jgi:hypothetical protein
MGATGWRTEILERNQRRKDKNVKDGKKKVKK